MGCHYDFHTVIDGKVVDADPDGFDVGHVNHSNPAGGGGSDPADDGGIKDGSNTRGGTSGASGPGANSGTGTSGATSAPGASSATGSGLGGPNPPPNTDPLERPIPNPFRDGMRLTFDVGSKSEDVTVSVYDLAGRLVRSLAQGTQSPGRHTVAWDGRDEQGMHVRKGMYFVHVRIGNQARQVRVTFLQ